MVHIDSTNRDSVCNGVLWVSDLSLLPASSSSVSPSSSSVAPASSSVAPASSSVDPASSSAKPASSSAAAPASSSVAPASSSVAPASSSAKASHGAGGFRTHSRTEKCYDECCQFVRTTPFVRNALLAIFFFKFFSIHGCWSIVVSQWSLVVSH